MKQEQKKKTNAFENAVQATSDISTAYRKGLQALRRADLAKIKPGDSRKIDGSVDIDDAVKALYPDANRWDYVLGYNSKVCFVEVHPAYTSEIDTVIKKFQWLTSWLKDKASKLDDLPKMTPAFVWVQSGKCAILPTSNQAKKLASIGVPKPVLQLQ